MIFIAAYLFLINATGLVIMLVDKQKARKNQWRIPERTLLCIAAIGGSIGTLVGMKLFRHKTKHASFTIGVPLMLALQIMLAVLLMAK